MLHPENFLGAVHWVKYHTETSQLIEILRSANALTHEDDPSTVRTPPRI